MDQLKEENKKLLEYAIDTRDGVEYWNSKYKNSEQKIEHWRKLHRERVNQLENKCFEFQLLEIKFKKVQKKWNDMRRPLRK